MKKRSDNADHQADLREKITGLGKPSLQKSYYPELQRRLTELEESEAKLRESLAALENANEKLQQEIAERRQAEEALRESEENFRALYNDTPVMLHSVNPEGKIVSVSDHWLETMGYAREEVMGKPVFDFMMADSRRQAMKVNMPRFLQTGEVRNLEFQFVKKSGEIMDVLLSAVLDRDDSGEMFRTLGVVVDVTARKRAEAALKESEQKYRELVENANSIILRMTKEGEITFLNEFGQKFFGYTEDEIIGRHVIGTVVPETESTGRNLQPLMEEICADPKKFEYNINENIRSNGERVWIAWTNKMIFDSQGQLVEIMSIGSDITARKQAEAALRQGAEEMAALHAVAHQVSSSLALDQVVSIILGPAVHPLAPDLSLLYLWQGDELVFQGARPDDALHHNKAAQLELGECLCGLALNKGEPVYSPNIHTDPRCTLTACKEAGLRSFAALPLLSPEGVLGVLGLAWATAQEVEARADFLETIAQEIALGLYNAMLYAKLQDNVDKLDLRVQDLAALNQASQVFLGQIGVAATSQETCRLAVEHFGLLLAWVGLVYPGDFLVYPAASFGADAGYLNDSPITWDDSPAGRGPTGTAIRTRQPFIMNNIETDADFAAWREAARTRGYRSSAALPLCIGDEVLGVLNLYSEEADFFQADRLPVLQSLANQTAVALQKARLYEEIQRHAAELEDRVAERTAQLEATNTELDRFAYSVSHDLRAPLRAMQGFSQALLEDYAGELDPSGQDFARRIVAAAERMDRLIQDLLAYSRLSREEMALQPVSLEQTVAEAMAYLEGDLRARQVQVRVEPPLPEVQAHHATLLQVVANLVNNAIKFTAPDVKPQVRLWAEARGERVRLWVEDNGLGIAPEHQERIFRIFERLHGVEAYPGTGIGLAIVKKGVERMGGQAGVESTPGQGSKFWVDLEKAV